MSHGKQVRAASVRLLGEACWGRRAMPARRSVHAVHSLYPNRLSARIQRPAPQRGLQTRQAGRPPSAP